MYIHIYIYIYICKNPKPQGLEENIKRELLKTDRMIVSCTVAYFIHLLIYIGGGFIGEKTLDCLNSDKIKFSFVGEKNIAVSKNPPTDKATIVVAKC